jgi:opacity protein-like surface antigen
VKNHLLALFVLAALAAHPAMAADILIKAPDYRGSPALYNWTGVYVGASAGYGWRVGSVGFAPDNATAAADFSG